MDPSSLKKLFKVELWQILLRLPESYVDASIVTYDLLNHDCEHPAIIDGTISSPAIVSARYPAINGVFKTPRGQTFNYSHFCKPSDPYVEKLCNVSSKRRLFSCTVKRSLSTVYISKPLPIPSNLGAQIIPMYGRQRSKSLKDFGYAEILKEHIDELIPATADYIRHELENLKLSNGHIRRLLNVHKMTIEDVVYHVHFPTSLEQANTCKIILHRLACALLLVDVEDEPELAHPLSLSLSDTHFNADAPFNLTSEQCQATSGILSAIRERKPRSVLFGDVGTGKTIVGAIVARHVIEANGRVAILIPNLILGAQIYREIDACWPEANIEFLVSKQECRTFTEQGYRCISEVTTQTQFVIGTTALVNNHNNVPFDLLWVDEEQKMGLSVKEETLITKGRTHLLMSSATCIPRTQAMMSLGMVPYYALTKYHTPRTVTTELHQYTDIGVVAERTTEVVRNGEKVLIICTKKAASTKNQSGTSDRIDATSLYQEWHAEFGDIVKLSHGGLSKEDNERAINEMKTGNGRVLISTTLIEVGVSIPKLRYVVVLDPQNLGVVTLHQIRGRVSREGGHGRCDLLPSKAIKEDSMKRLQLLVDHADGFRLAEEDLKMRGMGDLKHGKKQSGSTSGILIDQQIHFNLMTEVVDYVTRATENPSSNL